MTASTLMKHDENVPRKQLHLQPSTKITHLFWRWWNLSWLHLSFSCAMLVSNSFHMIAHSPSPASRDLFTLLALFTHLRYPSWKRRSHSYGTATHTTFSRPKVVSRWRSSSCGG